MRLTIEFESELWRVRSWWHRFLCKHFGHPGWKEPSPSPLWLYAQMLDDGCRRCVRCGARHPEDKPKSYTYTFPEGRSET